MASKPQDLIYGLDDKPPLADLLIIGCQHIFLMSSTLVLPIVLITEIGGTFDEVRSVIALTMIACGIGTIVQALRCRFVGSGFLCPNICGPNFFTASMEAAWLGGLPLMRGMTIIAGIAEAVFSRLAHRLAFLFPPEITGLVVLMVAQGLVTLGVSKFLGITFEGEPIQRDSVLIASTTLLIMIGVNIWGRGNLRLYSVFLGFSCGYLLAIVLGVLPLATLQAVLSVPWVALPFLENSLELTFDWSLVPVFVIVAITGALKSFGNLIMCEKINDTAWKAPNMRRISNLGNEFGAARRRSLRHLGQQRRAEQGIGRHQPRHRLCGRRSVHPARLLPQGLRSAVGDAIAGYGCHPCLRIELHDHFRHADHPGLGDGHPQDIRHRHSFHLWHEP